MFGNILIVLALVFYALLANLTQKPMPGGDYGVGYAFAWMICIAGFGIFTGLSAWNMNYNQCFDWLPANFILPRNGLVFVGSVLFIVVVMGTLDYRTKSIEGEFPEFMRWLTLSKVHYWLPALTFIPALYLLNTQRQAGFAPSWIKFSLIVSFSVCILIGLGIFYGFVKASVQRRIALHEAAQKESGTGNWAFDTSMDAINQYKENTIHNLLRYTHREQDKRLRDAAVAKIKTYENWETELTDTLEQGELPNVYWVYAFLDGNNIEHPDNFIQPVEHSIGRISDGVRASLKDPYSLDMGYVNIEAFCRVLDTHFKDSATVFRPGIESLQKALEINAPERKDKKNKQWFDETLSASRMAVKNWLESNK